MIDRMRVYGGWAYIVWCKENAMAFSRIVVVSLALMMSAAAANTQIIPPPFLNAPDSAVVGQPFSATRKTTTVQKLADGTTITREQSERLARNSQGITLSETKPNLPQGALHRDFTFTHIYNPIDRTTTSWSSTLKQATVYHMHDPERLRQQSRKGATQPCPVPAAGKTAVAQKDSSPQPETRTEKLDGKTIEGVYAEGVRITTTIPAGYEGNDRPIVTVRETWTSPELKTVLLQTIDDPRSGLSTTALTELQCGEPDPALFRVPEGYTVKDVNPQQQ